MTPVPVPLLAAPALIGGVLLLQCSAALPGRWLHGAVAAGAAMAALAAWWCARRGARGAGVLALAALSAGGWVWAALVAVQRVDARLPRALEGVELRVRGVVDELPVAMQRGTRFTFAVERCERAGARDAAADGDEAATDGAAPDGSAASPTDSTCRLPPRLLLGWTAPQRRFDAAPPTVRPGQRWTLVVRLKRTHAPINFGGFDRELRWLQEGIGAVGSVRSGTLVDEHASGAMRSIERLRLAVRDAVFDAAGPERARLAGVLAALAIGDQAAIDASLWALFNRTGVGHLMSI